jgi:hypothetical protein
VAATWTHHETDPEGTTRVLLALGMAPDPGAALQALPPDKRIRLLRAISATTAAEVADLGGRSVLTTLRASPPPADSAIPLLGEQPDLRGFASREHLFVASTLARTAQVLVGPRVHAIQSVATTDGLPAVLGTETFVESEDETGLGPVVVAVIAVAAIAAGAYALVQGAQIGANFWDAKLAREADTARMLGSQANALKVVDGHLDREKQAGRALAWDPQELKLFEALVGAQKQIAARENRPLPSPFQGAIDALGKGAESFGAAAPWVLAAAAAAFIMTR